MNFARTEEQEELASIVRSLLDRHSDSTAVRSAIGSGNGFDAGLWRALCEQVGVAALPVPEEYDGFGASLVETAVVLEEVGRNLAPSPLLATAIATGALLLHGDDDARSDLLPRVAAGEVATLALDDTDDLVLDAPAAGIVLRLHDRRLEVLEDLQVEPVGALDQTLRFGRVSSTRHRSVGRLVDPGPVRALAAALTTALQVGAAQRGLDMTVAYTRERVQFGRPIGSFQALKHRMADMLVLVEASRSASWGATAAAAAYVSDPSEQRAAVLQRHAAVARSYCSDALDHVASETVQLHGGIAITWEHDAQLLFKRAHALGQLFGPAHVHRARLV
jgi:alkylation response protein AidB-like acyl-CoA dehydrogenase